MDKVEIFKWLNSQMYQTEREEIGEYLMYYGVDMPKILEDYYEYKVKKLNEPAVSKCDGIERESSCNHSDWIDLYYDSGDWYGRYCKDCGEFFE